MTMIRDDGLLSVALKGNTVSNLFGNDGDFEGSNGVPISINSLNGSSVAQITYSTEYKVLGNTSAKLVSASGQYTRFDKDRADIIQGKYYFISAYRRMTAWVSGEFRIQIGDISTGSSKVTIAGASAVDSGFTRFGGKLEGRAGGTKIIFGNASSAWEGIAYLDGAMIVEISASDYNSLTFDQLIQKYPYISGVKSTLSINSPLSN